MKTMKTLYVLAIVLCVNVSSGQENLQLTSRDSLVESSWIFGLGYNFVDDSGDVFDNLFDFENQWNAVAFPSRISIGRYFKSGLGIEAIGTYNKYKVGKIIDKSVNLTESDYFGVDARLSYDLNKLIGQTAWFDPYVGVGVGYTEASNQGRGTYNAVVGFRTWINDNWGLDFSSSGKWRIGDKGTNHIQHAAGVVYQFGIEKGLSKKGKEKLALIEAIEKEQQRKADSIADVNRAREAQELADRLAKEKEAAKLAAIEKAKQDAINKKKLAIENKIKEYGLVYFKLNSSYLSESSKKALDAVAKLLTEEPNIEIKITAHTDSRGGAKYNKWLSEKRGGRTKDYLLKKGIEASRIVIEAYGEEKLLNECDDNTYCPEDKHRLNRRSDMNVIKF